MDLLDRLGHSWSLISFGIFWRFSIACDVLNLFYRFVHFRSFGTFWISMSLGSLRSLRSFQTLSIDSIVCSLLDFLDYLRSFGSLRSFGMIFWAYLERLGCFGPSATPSDFNDPKEAKRSMISQTLWTILNDPKKLNDTLLYKRKGFRVWLWRHWWPGIWIIGRLIVL